MRVPPFSGGAAVISRGVHARLSTVLLESGRPDPLRAALPVLCMNQFRATDKEDARDVPVGLGEPRSDRSRAFRESRIKAPFPP